MTGVHRRSRRRRLGAAVLALAVVFVAAPASGQDDGSDPGVTSPPVVPTTIAGAPTTTLPGTQTTPTTLTPGGGAPTSSPATVSPSSVAAGQSVTVSGASGFAPSQTLSITFDAASATPSTAFSNASGGFTATVTVPGGTASGSHRITVTGRNAQGGQHQSVGTVSVTLAQTGAGQTVTMAIVGIVLVALGYRLVERVRWSPAVSTPGWRRPTHPRR
ncbi:MAG: hypothetical protein ACRD0Q_02760 [Acidimicrobiales bacterium]